MKRTPMSGPVISRRIRWLLGLGLVVAVAAVATTFGQIPRSTAPSSSVPPLEPMSSAPPPKAPRGEHRGAPGKADGVVPGGVTVFDDDFPAVANLDAHLLKSLRRAATDAANDGVRFFVNSGWRSPKYQNELLRDALSKYGSPAEAARWVATPATSLHVAGKAVDIGRTDAAAWLAARGAEYGLCQIYRNEPWHYELRAGAVGRGCPPMYADPTQDPRLRK
ncbi:peptidase M15 [Actinomadura sp. DSM 109109]|nr:peptidase M15 [Actinomadura lepetitiana]